MVDAWAWRWSRSFKFFSLLSLAQKACSGNVGPRQGGRSCSAEDRQTCPGLPPFTRCSSRAHALPFQRAFLSGSDLYLTILHTGFCTLKAVVTSFLPASPSCIACMFSKATRRYNVRGRRRCRFEDQGPMGGGDLSKRFPLTRSLIRFTYFLQKSR